MSQVEDRDQAPDGRPTSDNWLPRAAFPSTGETPPMAAPGAGPDKLGWTSNTFAALRLRPYRHLWAGGVFSFLSFQMQNIARGWLAFQLTGSNSILGAVMFAFGVPMLLLTPWGGVAADRFPKRRIILSAQFTLVLSGLMVAVAIVFDALTVPILLLSAVFQGAAMSFLGPARMAFTGVLVGRGLLPNAIVLQQMSIHGTRVFGPSLAGFLIALHWFGPAGVYFLTVAFTVLASILTTRLPSGQPSDERIPGSPIAEFVDGLRYVRQNPHLMLLLVVSLTVIMTAFPYVAFLPTLAEDVFDVGSEGFGLMSGVTGFGALLAALLIAGRIGGPKAWQLQASAGMVFGVGLVMLWVAPSLWVALVILFFVGGANASFQAVNNTLVLTGSESAYHGRMQSLMMLSFSGFGLMALPLGVVADAIGLQRMLAIMGMITIVAMACYFAIRPVLERRHPTPVITD